MAKRLGSPIKISIFPALSNITSIFTDINPNSISTDDLKAAIFDIYGPTTKVVVSQFPDLLALIAPEIQVSIIAEGKRIQIVNQRRDLGNQVTENYLKLVSQVNKKIIELNKLTAFGLNYSAKIELANRGTQVDSSILLTKLSVNQPSTVEKLLAAKIVNSSFNVVFLHKNNRLDLRLNPELSANLEGTNKINATLNVHNVTKSFPDYSDLMRKYKIYLVKFQQDCDVLIHLAAV